MRCDRVLVAPSFSLGLSGISARPTRPSDCGFRDDCNIAQSNKDTTSTASRILASLVLCVGGQVLDRVHRLTPEVQKDLALCVLPSFLCICITHVHAVHSCRYGVANWDEGCECYRAGCSACWAAGRVRRLWVAPACSFPLARPSSALLSCRWAGARPSCCIGPARPSPCFARCDACKNAAMFSSSAFSAVLLVCLQCSARA